MEQVSYNLRLDLKDTGIVNTGFRLKQGDSGMKISVSIFNRGVNVFDSTTVPKIVFKRPDGASVMANMTVGASVYEYVFVGNELQQPGVEIVDVKFTLPNDRRESTVSCSFVVVPDTITPNTHGSDIYDNDLAELVAEATAAAETVEEVVGDSEAWAVGERNGVPVGPEDPAYHNNSKWWSEQANVTSLAALTDVDLDNPEDGDGLVYDSASQKWKDAPIMTQAMQTKLGAKNKARITATTQTVDGITYTIDQSAGTVIASGSLAAGKTSSYLAIGKVSVVAGDILTGCPVGGGSSDYELVVFNSSQTARIAADIGNGVVATSTDANAVIGIYIRKNLPSAIRFEPMVRIAEFTDSTFEPYAKTNRELTLSLIPEDISSQVTAQAAEINSFKVYRLGKIVIVSVITTSGIEVGTGSWVRRSLLTGLPYTSTNNSIGISFQTVSQKIPCSVEMSGGELRCAKEYGATSAVDYSQSYFRINFVYVCD